MQWTYALPLRPGEGPHRPVKPHGNEQGNDEGPQVHYAGALFVELRPRTDWTDVCFVRPGGKKGVPVEKVHPCPIRCIAR